jgi:hypothetical protein
MSRLHFAALAALVALIPAASAGTYTESGTAGQTLATAQIVNTQPLGTALDAIFGTLPSGIANVYEIYLTGGQTFSATTVNNTTFFDSELFLFDSNGLGVYANDDDPNSPPQSTLPAGVAFTPSASGIYYLAIAGSAYLPVSSGGLIFPSSGGFLATSGPDQLAGPTGPGGASPLTGWNSTSSETGDYEIDLTGAQFVSATPEPSSGLLLSGGLLLAGLLRRRSAR